MCTTWIQKLNTKVRNRYYKIWNIEYNKKALKAKLLECSRNLPRFCAMTDIISVQRSVVRYRTLYIITRVQNSEHHGSPCCTGRTTIVHLSTYSMLQLCILLRYISILQHFVVYIATWCSLQHLCVFFNTLFSILPHAVRSSTIYHYVLVRKNTNEKLDKLRIKACSSLKYSLVKNDVYVLWSNITQRLLIT